MAGRLAYGDFLVRDGIVAWAQETRVLADLKSASSATAGHVAFVATVGYMAMMVLGAAFLIVAFGDAPLSTPVSLAMVLALAAGSWAIWAWAKSDRRAADVFLMFQTEKSVRLGLVSLADAKKLVQRILHAQTTTGFPVGPSDQAPSAE